MFTETELREAMQHSAERADRRIDAEQHGSTGGRPVDHYVPLVQPTTVRRRTWLPLAAAAAAVAVAGGAVVLTAGHHSSRAPHKNSAAASGPAGPVKHRPAAAQPAATVAITNLVTIPGQSGYELKNGTEWITPPGGGMQLMVFPAGRFDPTSALTGAHPITVAGVHGYAGQALIYLIDPHDKDQASKAGAPRNTIAWPAGDGTWLVLQNFMADGAGFTDTPVPTLVHDAEHFGVQLAPAPLRSGYRVGWLPAGMSLTDVTGTVGQPVNTLTLTAGKKSITIQLSTVGAVQTPVGGDVATASRTLPGGTTVQVIADGYDKATAQHVLNGLDVSRLTGPPSGWWTLAQAVNAS